MNMANYTQEAEKLAYSDFDKKMGAVAHSEPVAEPGSWLSDIKRLVESNRLPDEESMGEEDLDRHADQIAAHIEATLMSLPVDRREEAIYSGLDWLIEAGAWTQKSFARAYGIVLGEHVCGDKYGIQDRGI